MAFRRPHMRAEEWATLTGDVKGNTQARAQRVYLVMKGDSHWSVLF